ncbi:hypothetical protein [Halovivax limisalsi]|uniref:DNA replication complex subunit Gins51 n=1 Tax=Halovivax limisalsi TaxID=1453760 RepID=UPI001FFDEBB3|nr:hypothetical protein [Halovivax limisalsi]
MNLEELRSVRNTERQRDSLQDLRPSFYREVGEYIDSLEAERDDLAAASDDPFASPDVTRLTNEIETAKDVAEAIYERRMGKLVKQASLAAAGLNADSEGLTDEERALFSDLVERIETNKAEILSVLDGEGVADGPTPDSSQPPSATEAPPAPPEEGHDPTGTSPTVDEGGVSAADVMAGDSPAASDDSRSDESANRSVDEGTDRSTGETSDGSPDGTADRAAGDSSDRSTDGTPTRPSDGDPDGSAADESSVSDRDVDRVTVQIKSDVGAILGVDDREYTLSSDDVVTLPEANATPLIERDAAEPLE